jgi:hypothetical protein
LWLPVVLKGNECLGAPSLRPKEFAEKLGQVLDEIRAHRLQHAKAPSSFWHA